MSEKIIDMMLKLDIEKMNEHLPANQKTLAQLMQEDSPSVNTKKNRLHKFRKTELELIASFFPPEDWINIKLPIILLRRTELEKGLYSVSGGIHELFIIHRVSGKTTEEFYSFKAKEHKPYIWKPETFTVIRKIGSIVSVGYT
ncbi:MAG: DUF61 family protein [Asgard group archaeon]|nr:DUF61 family protein [Asgard group archaeon]